MSGHERHENFDSNAINRCFLFSNSRLNLVGFINELGVRKVVTRITYLKCYAVHGYFYYVGYLPTNHAILARSDMSILCFESNASIKPKENISLL